MNKLLVLGACCFLLCQSLIAQNASELRIDSVLIDDLLFLPDPELQQQTAEEVIGLLSPEVPFRAVSNLPQGVDSVYWRVSFDYDDDGDFTDFEDPFGPSVLYESGAISAGSTPSVFLFFQGLNELPPNARRTLRIEVVEDPTDFGTEASSIFNVIMEGPGGRVTTADKKKGSGSSGERVVSLSGCRYMGVLQNNTLQSEIYNWRPTNTTCLATVELVAARIYRLSDPTTPYRTMDLRPTIGVDQNEVELTVPISGGTGVLTYNRSTQFDLAVGQSGVFTLNLPINAIDPSQISAIAIDINYEDCNTNEEFVLVTDSLCFGCNDFILYDRHSSSPVPDVGKEETQLPALTYRAKRIEARDSVMVRSGDSTEFVVNNDGFIHVTAETKVEQSAYFWAHKEVVCPIMVSSTTDITEGARVALDRFIISPNPAYETVEVFIDLTKQSALTIAVYDLLGRRRLLILNNEWQQEGSQSYSMNISSLEAGLYYCRVLVDGQIYIKSIIKV